MPRTAILFGVLLIALGIGDYYSNSDRRWLLVVLPAALGAAILILGIAALLKRSWRRGAMHAAVIVGLVGFVATFHALIDVARKVLAEPNLLTESTMAVLCGVFVFLAFKSFIVARLKPEEPVIPAADALAKTPPEQVPGSPTPSPTEAISRDSLADSDAGGTGHVPQTTDGTKREHSKPSS